MNIEKIAEYTRPVVDPEWNMRGIICVERGVGMQGEIKWLPLADQHHYREWLGCFSLLGKRQ